MPLALLIATTWPEYHIARIERNQVVNESGHVVLDQLIFERYETAAARFVVVDWLVIKQHTQIPTKDWASDQYVWCGKLRDGRRVLVRAEQFDTVRSDYDREMVVRGEGWGDRGWFETLARRTLADDIFATYPASQGSDWR